MSAAEHQQKQFLVTGGCGFIGSHITDSLIDQGHKVIVIDDLSTGHLENLNPKACLYQGDVADRIFLDKVFSQCSVDYVIHQAAKINTNVLHESPSYDVRCSVLGTINLAECCLTHNVDRLVFASSVAVYGRPKDLLACETVRPEPIYSYGIAKFCAEEYLNFYANNHGLKYHALRYSNVFGPRQPIYGEVGVIAIFTDRIIKNEPMTVYGDGQHIRDFIYVSDVVDFTLKVFEVPDCEVFNVGRGIPVTVNELFDIFKKFDTEHKAGQHRPERVGEIGKFYCDASKALSTGWKPSVLLEEGIGKTIESFQ